MKIVSENPDEDLLLENLIKKIQDDGYHYVYGESFGESFAKEAFSAGFFHDSKVSAFDISLWKPEQRIWFYQICETFAKSCEYKKVMEDFFCLMGVYDEIFKEETKVFEIAKKDYAIYCVLEKNINLLHVDRYGKLQRFLEKAMNKGPDRQIKTVSTYYDQDLNAHVIELNSIKVPIYYENQKLCSQAVIYAWSDVDFSHSHEFFKYDLLGKEAEIKAKAVKTRRPKREVLKEEVLMR